MAWKLVDSKGLGHRKILISITSRLMDNYRTSTLREPNQLQTEHTIWYIVYIHITNLKIKRFQTTVIIIWKFSIDKNLNRLYNHPIVHITVSDIQRYK